MSYMTTVGRFSLTGLLVLAFSLPTKADEPTWEDLTACKLPNAKMILPGQGTALARKEGGTVFAFSTRTFSPELNFKEGGFTVAKFIAALKGDIYYAVPEGGCFMVTSGRIVDLGKHYLHDFDGKELPRPDIVTSKEDGQDVPGLLTGTEELTGHCFLLEAKGGKAVLLRIISQDRKRGESVVQWVFQPDGTRRFTIPKGKIIIDAPTSGGDRSAPGTPVRIDIPQLDMREFGKAARMHLKNRKKLVHLSISLVSSKDADLSNRHFAAILLGQLRAVEGAPALAARVDDNLAMVSLRITVSNSYRCVQSLIDIGIPGALAAITQIKSDAKSEQLKEADQRLWNERMELRRNLLALAVLKVYGEELAKIVLEDRIAQTEDSKVKEAYQKALKAFPRIKNWLPEEKTATTMPIK